MRRLPGLLICAFSVAASAQTVEHPLAINRDVEPPVVIYQVTPILPSPKPRYLKSGDSIISITVDEFGKVHDPQIVRTCDARLNESMLTAVRQYRFRPASRNGTAVAVRMDVTISQLIF